MLSRRTAPRRHDATSRELRVAILCSTRAPGLRYLLDDDPNRGAGYELVAGVTSNPACVELLRLKAAGASAVVHDIRAFYTARGVRRTDLRLRGEYDRHTVQILGRFRPDLVVLCGYLHTVTEPLLSAYPNRVINLHDSDLGRTGRDGRPKYRGLRSTRDAIFAGESVTRSTVHLVTPEVDDGPALLRSWAFRVHPLVEEARRWGATDILKAYAYAHREWMMRASWGPLLARAIELFALGQVRFVDGRAVVAGALGPEELPAETTAEACRASAGD